MKTLSLSFICSILFVPCLAQFPSLDWVRKCGSADWDIGRDVAVDSANNVINCGLFESTVDFNPGSGSLMLTSAGQEDIFIQKLDPQGNLLWAKRFGGVSSDICYSVTADHAGNIIATGSFQQTVDFDPGSGTMNATAVGSDDIFILKLDPNGNLLWFHTYGSTSLDVGHYVVVDNSNNIYFTGYHRGTVDFDAGPGTATHTAAGTSGDVFVLKLGGTGNLIFAKWIGSTGHDWGNSLWVDSINNIYTTGRMVGTIDADPGAGVFNLTGTGLQNAFVQKLDANGNFLWAKRTGGNERTEARSIVTDASSNVIVTGEFKDTIDIDPGPGILQFIAPKEYNFFIQKLDPSGNLMWAGQLFGGGPSHGGGLVTDAAGNIFLTGAFRDTIDFDPGIDTLQLISAGFNDSYIMKLDPNGNLVWVIKSTGIQDEFGTSLKMDNTGDLLVGGSFSGTNDFNPGTGTTSLTSAGEYDIFIQKLNLTSVGLATIIASDETLVFPNPSSGIVNITLNGTDSHLILVTDMHGKLIYEKSGLSAGTHGIDLSNHTGSFIVAVQHSGFVQYHKVVVDGGR